MQADNQNILFCDEIIAQRRAKLKAIDGKALSDHLKKLRKTDFKQIRRPNSFKSIPETHYMSLMELGRGRYRAIVVSTIMSLLWDGWKSKKKTRRIPNNKVMLTRRMLSQHFDMCASTAEQAFNDLVNSDTIIIAQKPVYSGKQGKNLGTLYCLPWMENPKGKQLHIYWGLLVSEPFLRASVTLQAVIILLHGVYIIGRRTASQYVPALSLITAYTGTDYQST